MSDEAEGLRDRLNRYCELLKLCTDPRAAEVLREMIAEIEATLRDGDTPKPDR